MGYDDDERQDIGVGTFPMSYVSESIEQTLELLTLQEEDPDIYSKLGITKEQVLQSTLILGHPGIGKSCIIVGSIARLNEAHKDNPKRKLGLVKILLGTKLVGAFSGMPLPNAKTGKWEHVTVNELPTEERNGKYGVLFLDEITTADVDKVTPLMPLIDATRSIGDYTLPPNWIVIAAGNGPTDRNFKYLDEATLTKFTHKYEIDYNYSDFKPYAHMVGISSDILAFLNMYPELVYRSASSDDDKSDKVGACPRTWEQLDSLIKVRKGIARSKMIKDYKNIPANLKDADIDLSIDELSYLARQAVGVEVASKFTAFMTFKPCLETVSSPREIVFGVNGNINSPAPPMGRGDGKSKEGKGQAEVIEMLLEGIFTELRNAYKGVYGDYYRAYTKLIKSGARDYNTVHQAYIKCAKPILNALNWIFSSEAIKADTVFRAVFKVTDDLLLIDDQTNKDRENHIGIELLFPDDIEAPDACPAFSKFTEDYGELILKHVDELKLHL